MSRSIRLARAGAPGNWRVCWRTPASNSFGTVLTRQLGFRRRGGNDLIPASGRRLGGGRLVGLRLGHERFDIQLGALQLPRVKTRGNFVALLGGVIVATPRGKREPLVGFCGIALDPDATGCLLYTSDAADE